MSSVRRNFPVEGMGCAACVARVENAIKAHKGVHEVNVSLATAIARVDYDSSVCSPESIRKAVQDAGYNLVIEGTADEVEDEADRSRERFLRELRRDTIYNRKNEMYKTEKRNVHFFRLFSRRRSGFQTAFNQCSKASQISRLRGFFCTLGQA